MQETWNLLLVIFYIFSGAAGGLFSRGPKHKYNEVECQLECNNKYGLIEAPNAIGLIPITKARVWEDKDKNSFCNCVLNSLSAQAARARHRSTTTLQPTVRMFLQRMGLSYEAFAQEHEKSSKAGRKWLKAHGIKVHFPNLDLKKMRKEVEKDLAAQSAEEEAAGRTKPDHSTDPLVDCKAKCNNEYGFLYDPPRPPITNPFLHRDNTTKERKCYCEVSLQLVSILKQKELNIRDFEAELEKGPGFGRYWLTKKGFQLTPVEVVSEHTPIRTAYARPPPQERPDSLRASSSSLSDDDKAETPTVGKLTRQKSRF